MTQNRVNPQDHSDASILRRATLESMLALRGFYEAECVGPDGKIKWRDTIRNTIMTEGANFALDTILAGSAYTVVGPYMGLISSVSYTAIAAGDTAAQINGTNGWTEAGATNAPTYTAPRPTAVFSAASAGSKALSSALAFSITGAGTAKGCFMIFGAGAVSTIDSTTGVLLSAGLFTGGDKVVSSGDTINASWSLSA